MDVLDVLEWIVINGKPKLMLDKEQTFSQIPQSTSIDDNQFQYLIRSYKEK
jgi:hypothetical protein